MTVSVAGLPTLNLPGLVILSNSLIIASLRSSVEMWCMTAMQRVASNMSLTKGSFTASQQNVSVVSDDSFLETDNNVSDRSQPIMTMSGLTPKYLPSPQPTSATTLPAFSDMMKFLTLCQYTFLFPRV